MDVVEDPRMRLKSPNPILPNDISKSQFSNVGLPTTTTLLWRKLVLMCSAPLIPSWH